VDVEKDGASQLERRQEIKYINACIIKGGTNHDFNDQNIEGIF